MLNYKKIDWAYAMWAHGHVLNFYSKVTPTSAKPSCGMRLWQWMVMVTQNWQVTE